MSAAEGAARRAGTPRIPRDSMISLDPGEELDDVPNDDTNSSSAPVFLKPADASVSRRLLAWALKSPRTGPSPRRAGAGAQRCAAAAAYRAAPAGRALRCARSAQTGLLAPRVASGRRVR